MIINKINKYLVFSKNKKYLNNIYYSNYISLFGGNYILENIKLRYILTKYLI